MAFAVNTIPIPQKLDLPDALKQKYTKPTTSSISNIKVYLDPFTSASKETGIPNSLVKIAKGVADFFSTLEDSVPAKNFITNCSIFGDFLKVFSMTKGIDDILVNADKKREKGINLHQRNLGIVSGVFQTVLGGMAGVKLLNTFQIISLAQISEALGTTAVLPFAAVTNGIDIIKNIVDITSSSIKLHQINVKNKKKRKYLKRFNTKANSTKIGDFLKKHINQIETKQVSAEEKIKNLRTKASIRKLKAQDALNAYNTTNNSLNTAGISNFQKFILGIKLARKEAALFKAMEAHEKNIEDFSNIREKYNSRFSKLESWTKARDHFIIGNNSIPKRDITDTKDPLNQLIADKQIKWKAQRENFKTDKRQEGLGITISVIATIILIASTVLIFSGIGTIPLLLTITSLGLIVSILGLGKTLLKKYTKPATVIPANFPKSFAAA